MGVVYVGYGRYVAIRVANMFVVLIIITAIVAVLFAEYEQQELEAQLREELRAWMMSPEAQNIKRTNPEDWPKVVEIKKQEIMHKLGLDKPLSLRIIERIRKVLTLDFGTARSVRFGGTTKITAMMAKAIPMSMAMFTTATVINMIVGILLGAYIATHVGSVTDRSVSIVAMLGWSMPTWWLAMVMIVVLAVKLEIAPLPGPMNLSGPWYAKVATFMYRLYAPVLTLFIVAFGGWAWYTRNLLISIFQEDYITVARAKGVPERKVLYGHALRSAAPPFITVILASLVGSMWGGIISEVVWNWPGMGLLYWQALSSTDVPVLMALTFVGALLTVLVYLTMDLLYGVFDPRVRVGTTATS